MSLVIGLDTGGTYTDAALLDAASGQVLATGKALTTREDLSIGLGGAIARVLDAYVTGNGQTGGGQTGGGKPGDIGLVSLSTTLATNAVVEGVGGRVGLVMIGFDEAALERADLARALGQDPVAFITGGHKPDGGVQAMLDRDALRHAAETFGDEVSAFAIAGHFATRNPEHEMAARDLLRELTGLPITCSHELSSALGGPRRALTAVLNARLINLLERLITATEAIMADQGLTCPLMVVKGDGSLLHSDFARTRPVETVLSGPAASLSGAAFLAGTDTALIADIGGTTTDIAFLQNGAPRLRAEGALVGGWQTMVEAAEIRTCGLGGDSEVRAVTRGRDGGVTLGPRRAVPLSLLATQHPEIIAIMEEQLGLAVPMQTDARFVFPVMPDGVPGWLTRSETRLAQKAIEMGPTPIAEIAATQLALGAVDRLISRGLLGLAAFTPTDAAHVTGAFTGFDVSAAELGAALMARQKNGLGEAIASDATGLAVMTLATLHQRSGLALMDAALAHDGAGEEQASRTPLLATLYEQHLKASMAASVASHAAASVTSHAAGNEAEADATQMNDPGMNDPGKNRMAGGTAGVRAGGTAVVRAGVRAGGEARLVRVGMQLETGLVALGASAATHYPHIADMMGVTVSVPDHADVAGAVGAAVGSVRQRVMISITAPADGKFRVHLPEGPIDLEVQESALERARMAAERLAHDRASSAGASSIEVAITEDVRLVQLGPDKQLFIEAFVHATASGQPG
jgi:N-methylhydantoinase A/oxoprolinase/acetone carboxylase beta subunit